MIPQRRWTCRWNWVVVAALWACGCKPVDSPPDVVARAGDGLLLESELETALQDFPATLDSGEARKRLIDQWIDSELLYQEALRRNIANHDSVKLRLEESERSILIDAMVSQLIMENIIPIQPSDISSYYENHRERLSLREPFAKVHYLIATDEDSIRTAQDIMDRKNHADTVFVNIAARFSVNPSMSLSLANNFLPERRLFADHPLLAEVLSDLRPGQTAPIIESGGHFHLVHLAGRAPTGSIPEIAWVEDVIQRQITINWRRQSYQQLVQQLRMKAIAADKLAIN